MSDIKLFRIKAMPVVQLTGKSVKFEKSLQTLIEKHLDVFLGIRFLVSEYSTGKKHGGRIDTMGIDENGCPCIIEYKRTSDENVISQGLYYLDWLLDHKAEFEMLVIKKYGQPVADNIEWSSPRLLCIAGDYTKYDSHAVQQINRNIELIRYINFEDEFLLLELVNGVQSTGPAIVTSSSSIGKAGVRYDKTVDEHLKDASSQLLEVFDAFKETCLSFGEDVQIKPLKLYVAFKRLKNFATVEVRSGVGVLACYVKLNPDSIELEKGFTRDVREIGHWGTGDLEITIKTQADLDKALPILRASYENA